MDEVVHAELLKTELQKYHKPGTLRQIDTAIILKF